MAEFFQTYGTWLILGGAFLLMMAMHGGHGAGHGKHGGSDAPQGAGKQASDEGASTPSGAQAKHAGGGH